MKELLVGAERKLGGSDSQYLGPRIDIHFSRTEVLKVGIINSEMRLRLYAECEALYKTRE